MSEEQPAPPSAPLPLPGNSNPDLDPQTLDHRLFEAARAGDVGALAALLDKHPDHLSARTKPYEWTLLHLAARHPAAAAGQLDVVRRLADAGGDVVGHGDDHELEVIGWATCWDECDDAAHRA